MFDLTNNLFTPTLEIHNKVDPDFFTDRNIKYFDNDGFELTVLEQEFYLANGINLSDCLNHYADQQDWVISNNSNLYVDHSFLVQRWCYVDEAREQIESNKNRFPLLNKYLKLIPKWGIDFALEYHDSKEAVELIHIELDYRNYDDAVLAKQYYENKIMSTDWLDFHKRLKLKRSEWSSLYGMAQNDWKASFWGMKKAEATFKSFA